MAQSEQVTLAVLAGGEGSRMGKAKGLLRIDDRPILTYLLDRLAWKGPTCVITAPGRERPPGAEGFGRELIDPEAGLGPIRGILTALEHVDSPLLVVATVDMPGIAKRNLDELNSALVRSPDRLGMMFSRASGGKAIVEPFPLALRRESLSIVREYMSSGRRSVHRLLTDSRFATTPGPADASVWTNLNYPADVERFRQTIALR